LWRQLLKAFLLAAGNGTRLRPLTDTTPKCLLPVRGVPLLQIWLDICKRFGIEEVLINLHSHSASVQRYLSQNANGTRVRIAEEPQLLGSAGTLRANRDWVIGDDCFWIFYADVLNCADLHNMMALHQLRKPVATIGVYRVPDPRRCGIVTLATDGTVREFVEKPANPSGNLAFSGLMIGTPQLMENIPDHLPVDIGFHVLPRLGGQMLAVPIEDYLIDIGTIENYQAAQTTWPGLRDRSKCSA
jgi:mannose-1-phosphate guanylyltransferase